ncbi:MAG TPA: phosphatase PAP2 family protein [Gaiellaceae bacterium]|nr:phosphatase PAP2 family protein [Gaiellaceae bacterium]
MTRSRLRGSLLLEAALLAGLYLAGELSRGLARGGEAVAERNAAAIVRAERHLHVFGEAAIQGAAQHVHGLPALLGYAYLTLHLAVTAGVLVWVHRRRRHAYGRLRNALVLANGLAVVGYALFPTAPPRLAGVGLADTVSTATSVDLGSAFAASFYNPYAAVPSMHIGFSLLVGAAVWRLARRPLWRAAGAVYPVFVLFVIVATGNHFFLDAAAGAAVALAAFAATGLAATARRRPVALPAHEFG